jgi:transposase-like protein
MIDGIHLGDHLVLIALGIDAEGKKQVLGLREGDTENGQVAKALLRDLVERGLDPERARLFVTDGAKALRSAIRKVFGDRGVVQRCQLHKQRNILGHLPEGMHESVKAILREAWSLRDAKLAKARLERLASSLETDHPGAAAGHRGDVVPQAAEHERDREPEQRHCRLLEEREALEGRIASTLSRIAPPLLA